MGAPSVQSDRHFRQDDEDKGRVMQCQRGNRAPTDIRSWRNLLDIEHRSNVSKIRPIIGDIVENDKRHVQSNGDSRDNFGKADGDHLSPRSRLRQFYITI
jgi:hypothetical protein